LLQQTDHCHNHSRSAEAALRAAVIYKCSLHRMQLSICYEALDGGNPSAIRLTDRNKAAIHQHAVEEHCARSTLAFSATFLYAGQFQVVS
jgi:hypothetical protein